MKGICIGCSGRLNGNCIHDQETKKRYWYKIESPPLAGSKKVVLKFLSINNMIIINLFTHIWLVEPKKNQLIFHAICSLDCSFLSLPNHTYFDSHNLPSAYIKCSSCKIVLWMHRQLYYFFFFSFCSKASFNGRVDNDFEHETK